MNLLWCSTPLNITKSGWLQETPQNLWLQWLCSITSLCYWLFCSFRTMQCFILYTPSLLRSQAPISFFSFCWHNPSWSLSHTKIYLTLCCLLKMAFWLTLEKTLRYRVHLMDINKQSRHDWRAMSGTGEVLLIRHISSGKLSTVLFSNHSIDPPFLRQHIIPVKLTTWNLS